jgi:hypothetical protein
LVVANGIDKIKINIKSILATTSVIANTNILVTNRLCRC